MKLFTPDLPPALSAWIDKHPAASAFLFLAIFCIALGLLEGV